MYPITTILIFFEGAAAVRDASSPANLADQKHVRKRKGSADLTDSQSKLSPHPYFILQ